MQIIHDIYLYHLNLLVVNVTFTPKDTLGNPTAQVSCAGCACIHVYIKYADIYYSHVYLKPLDTMAYGQFMKTLASSFIPFQPYGCNG